MRLSQPKLQKISALTLLLAFVLFPPTLSLPSRPLPPARLSAWPAAVCQPPAPASPPPSLSATAPPPPPASASTSSPGPPSSHWPPRGRGCQQLIEENNSLVMLMKRIF